MTSKDQAERLLKSARLPGKVELYSLRTIYEGLGFKSKYTTWAALRHIPKYEGVSPIAGSALQDHAATPAAVRDLVWASKNVKDTALALALMNALI